MIEVSLCFSISLLVSGGFKALLYIPSPRLLFPKHVLKSNFLYNIPAGSSHEAERWGDEGHNRGKRWIILGHRETRLWISDLLSEDGLRPLV